MTDLPLVGFGLPVSGRWATPTAMVRIARRAEDLGLASLWAFQRLLHPVGSDLGPGHRYVHDPISALVFAAAHTDRIGLGTATICAPYSAPPLLAQSLASLDVLSDGRLTVGLGMGWLPEEHVATSTPQQRRGERFEEYLRCLRALWTDDPVEFDGMHYTVPRSYVGPRVVQRPHPPILLGGSAEPALRRAGRIADGWIVRSDEDPATIRASVEVIRRAAREAGRDPASLRVLARVVVGETSTAATRSFTRSGATLRADLARLAEHGVTEVCVDPNLHPSISADGVDPADAVVRAEAMMERLSATVAGP